MKLRLIALCSTMLLLPIGLKLAIPAVLRSQETELLSVVQPQQIQPQYRVESVEGYTLTVRTADQLQLKVRLVGLQVGEEYWQNQAAAVITMVLNSSQATVSLTSLQPSTQPDTVEAIAQLPNGTSLQQILLADGLARLDRTQLTQFPAHFLHSFQEAENSARAQHKNIWGEAYSAKLPSP